MEPQLLYTAGGGTEEHVDICSEKVSGKIYTEYLNHSSFSVIFKKCNIPT